MKTNVLEINMAVPVINKLAEDVGLPFESRFQLAKIMKAIEPSVLVYQQSLKSLIKEHGDVDDKGTTTLRTDESANLAFNKINEEAQAQEVDIDGEKISMEYLVKSALTATDIIKILWLINE